MSAHELERFIETWEFETRNTVKILKGLPKDQYDFRPDPKGRSLGELAWHLAEIDAYMTSGLEQGRFDFSGRIPNLERPRTVEALAPGYERVHADAMARVRKLKPESLDETVPFFDGRPMQVRTVLWGALLMHLIHHRGALVLMCRLAGGTPDGIYGPNREATEAMRAARSR